MEGACGAGLRRHVGEADGDKRHRSCSAPNAAEYGKTEPLMHLGTSLENGLLTRQKLVDQKSKRSRSQHCR